jgi:hypothetical protein
MSKIIRLDWYKKEKEGDKLDRRILTKSIEEYLVLAKKFKEEVTNILDRRDWILRITQEELEKIFKNSILDFLIKKRQISSELFMCGDYVSIILRKFICWDIDLHKFTQDFLEEWDWKWAWDINLVKYIYWVWNKKREVNTPNDYKNRASQIYYNAYTRWQLKLWYNLARNLDDLDKIIDLPTFLKRVIPPNIALVG